MFVDKNIFIIISNLIRITLILKCIKLLFSEILVKERKLFYFYIYFYIISTLLYINMYNILLNMVFEVIGLFLITHCYKAEIWKKISAVSMIYTVDVICSITSAYTFKLLNLKDQKMKMIVGVIFIYICIMVIHKILLFNYNFIFKTEYLKLLFLFPVISIFIELLLLADGISTIVIIISIAILFLNLAIIYLFCFCNIIYNRIYEFDYMKKQVEYYRNELEVLSTSTKILRSAEHDIKHHTKTLYALAEKNKIKDLKEYLTKNWGEINNKKEFVKSGCIEIDSILNNLLVRAEKYINKININIKVPRGIKLYHMDLAVILGNLVENGIDALEICKDKFMIISIELRKGLLYIDIKNSKNNILKYRGDVIISTKDNPETHGLGLMNVKASVEKNGGFMEIKESYNLFEVKIIMFYSPAGC